VVGNGANATIKIYWLKPVEHHRTRLINGCQNLLGITYQMTVMVGNIQKNSIMFNIPIPVFHFKALQNIPELYFGMQIYNPPTVDSEHTIIETSK
jgi:hypothetical protein